MVEPMTTTELANAILETPKIEDNSRYTLRNSRGTEVRVEATSDVYTFSDGSRAFDGVFLEDYGTYTAGEPHIFLLSNYDVTA